MPKVTVLMTAFNEQKLIKTTIKSILRQSYSDFEFLIVDDASKDSTVSIIESFNDSRIRIIKNQENKGISESSNIGLKAATGEYIFRMDADDVANRDRIKKQVEFLDEHPNVGIVGSWLRYMHSYVRRKGPVDPKEVKASLFFHNVLSHPTVVLRKKCIDEFDIKYNPNYLIAHDYDLFCKGSHCFDVANIPKSLVVYRVHPGSISVSKRERMFQESREIKMNQLSYLKIKPTNEETEIHSLLLDDYLLASKYTFADVEKWALKLINTNEKLLVYDLGCFKKVVDLQVSKLIKVMK